MARFDRLFVLQQMLAAGVIPVFSTKKLSQAILVADAINIDKERFGFLEFTARVDHAVEIFSGLTLHCADHHPNLIVGAGSVFEHVTAIDLINRGAEFIVGPSSDQETARLCNRRGVLYIPGCGSMNEIVDAFDSGAWIVKVFPADSVGGGGFFKSVRAPMSWFRGMPTGGVKLSKDSMMTWMKNGTSCLGIGGDMVSKEILDSADWIALSQRMRDANQWIGEIRAELAEKEDK